MASNLTTLTSLIFLLAATGLSQAYWLMAPNNNLVTERLDPIVNPGSVSRHVHTVVGSSSFGPNITTAELRESECTSIPIAEDRSAYWFPTMYFQWENGSFSSVDVGAVIYYLFADESGVTTAFPNDFRMIAGTPTLRSYDPSSFAQQAITFLCLDYAAGVNTRTSSLPVRQCPDGVRSQINFPSCWDGKNADSADHKSHVSYLSSGPDSGTCTDPEFPVTLPRIFMEGYWDVAPWYKYISQAKNTSQPFVFAHGDPYGYGFHADFVNGWEAGVLQRAVDECHCDPYGDFTCCADAGIFTKSESNTCSITSQVNEQVLGTFNALPGNNLVTYGPNPATLDAETNPPGLLCNVKISNVPKRKRNVSNIHRRLVKRFVPSF